jgi:hypothetical protein
MYCWQIKAPKKNLTVEIQTTLEWWTIFQIIAVKPSRGPDRGSDGKGKWETSRLFMFIFALCMPFGGEDYAHADFICMDYQR